MVVPSIIYENMAIIAKHRCDELALERGDDDSVSIQYSDEFNSWVFAWRYYADEEEVKLGEAEYEGELMHYTETAISYCPYCGLKLKEMGSDSEKRKKEK